MRNRFRSRRKPCGLITPFGPKWVTPMRQSVMWRRGRTADQQGALELRQKGHTNFIPLFDLRGDQIKEGILAALVTGPKRVSLFCRDWPKRPEDVQCDAAYREALLQLEAEGAIDVLSKDARNVCGSDARPKRNGKLTLGEDYFVRKAANDRTRSTAVVDR